MAVQTRISRDPRRDVFEETPATFVSSYSEVDEVDQLLDRIDRVLRRERDVLPAGRTALSHPPEPIRFVGTADLELAAVIAPALQQMIETAQASLAMAVRPALQQTIDAVQASLVSKLRPALPQSKVGLAGSRFGQVRAPLPPTGDQVQPGGQPDVEQPRTTEHLERCLREIQSWLGIGLNDAARAAGIDRGTVYAWRRRGSDPRPGTVGAVLRLHSLVASVVAVLGAERAREWFHTGTPSPLERLIASPGDQSVMSTVARDVRRLTTALPPPNPLLGSTVDDRPARPLA